MQAEGAYASWLEPTIATLAALIAYFQWRTAQSQRASAETQLARSVAQEWRALGPTWDLAVTIANGIGQYYNESPFPEQARLLAIKRRGGLYGPSGFGAEDSYWESEVVIPAWTQQEVDGMSERQLQIEGRRYARSVRNSVNFLAELCSLILSGKLATETVYNAFGATLLNRAGAIRTMIKDDHYGYMLASYPAKVLLLMDLLWAHGVRVGDIDGEHVAQHKRRSGSGSLNRRRGRKLARQHGHPLLARRLNYLLTWAEVREPTRLKVAWHSLKF